MSDIVENMGKRVFCNKCGDDFFVSDGLHTAKCTCSNNMYTLPQDYKRNKQLWEEKLEKNGGCRLCAIGNRPDKHGIHTIAGPIFSKYIECKNEFGSLFKEIYE